MLDDNPFQTPFHIPVMVEEVIEGLAIDPNGIYVDLTFGGGGHAKSILRLLNKGHLYAFDKDMAAMAQAQKFLSKNLTFIRASFRYVKEFLRFYGVDQVDGIIADFGVSSYQIDQADRGFSIRTDGLLDMRMDQSKPFSARSIIERYSEAQIAQLLKAYGQIPDAKAIALAIVEQRQKKPILTTDDLKQVVEPFVPKYRPHKYLAKVFQAFRIEVNDELKEIEEVLNQCAEIVKPGGRIAMIAYHSLEDRLVKHFLRTGNSAGQAIKDGYGNLIRPFVSLNQKAIVPSLQAVQNNHRSRSAKLRIGIRTAQEI